MSGARSWSLRSVLISVRDLQRSIDFSGDLVGLREVAREGEVVVLCNPPDTSFALMLRQAGRLATRHGQQALGARALSFEVGSMEELDRVEERLQASGMFRARRPLDADESFPLVLGHDPDGLPLVFLTYEGAGSLTALHYRHVAAIMYTLDM